MRINRKRKVIVVPNINRIRVNNVKYNFGTQGYDDFSMRMYGKNTLYDLANGGGKSVLMLLLLQNLIPNCTLDEKQPIEKLFRNDGGNTTIHSLVEWRLDDRDIKEGFRYMTTGFCARKAKDGGGADEGQMSLVGMNESVESGVPSENDANQAAGGLEGTKVKTAGSRVTDSASIEYFNYCIFYRDYNDNDIVNLPLQNSTERITFTGLKNYLKDLMRRNLNLKVHIFERKGEYQRFISQYGLYESQWEIIRGINKTEGHVRTYFETHYKTTRKVVEDLLIEEIIEKAFLVKTEQNDINEDMAKALLDIKDKLVELSKKKSEIANYDKEAEMMHLLEGRVSSFLKLYGKRDEVIGTLADIYVTGEALSRQGEQQLAGMEIKKQEKEERCRLEQQRIESLKVQKDKYMLEDIREELKTLEDHIAKASGELSDAKAELDLKESVNDYIRYLADKAAMEENQAVVDADGRIAADPLERLRALAFTKKELDDKKLEDIRRQFEAKQKSLEALKQKEESLSHVCEEGTIALAVAESHRRQLEEEYLQRMEEIREVRQGISVLVLSDIKELTGVLEEEAEELKARKAKSEQEYFEDIQAISENERSLYAEQEELKQARESLEQAEKRHGEYVMNQDRLKKMMEIYGGKDAASLYETIKERAFEHRIAVANLEREIARLNRHLEQVQEGRILEESLAVTKVKDYLESRHGDFALSGVDYLSALPVNNREELLERFPMLPYGVVTKNFDTVMEDERIGTIDLGNQAVPIYNQDTLESPYIPSKEEGVILIAKDKASFLEEDALAMELSRLEKRLGEMRGELERLLEIGAVYDEDLDYTAKLTDAAFINAGNEVQSGQEAVLDYERRIQKRADAIERLKAHSTKVKELLDKAEKELAENNREQVKLAGIQAVSDLADEVKERFDYYSRESARLKREMEKAESERSAVCLQREETEQQAAHLKAQIADVLADWESLYKDYYVEGKYEAVNLPEEQIKAEFLSTKAVFEQQEILLEDKKKLIAALKESMERGMRIIRRRGISIEVLEDLRAQNELHPVEEAFISRMSMHVSQISVRCDQLSEEYKKKEHEATHLEGRIEQAEQAVIERFGSLLKVEAGRQEAEQAIAEGGRLLKKLREEMKAFEQEYQRYRKNHGVIVDLYKDVKRIVENEDIETADAKALTSGQEEIREIFEESLLAYDKSNKAISRANQELLTYKTQTADAFFAMGAYELSGTIRDDVQIPGTYEEAKVLLDNIREMISYIALEKERIGQGIEDMEAIKSNFENQCIERCRDVRMELEKLPKLSRIQLDGETIQMVSLSIPYVKDEFIEQRMSDYIDEVVNGADKFKDNTERIRYMKNQLLLKRLFSVMVTDMNAIRLKLYKRERMKELSRYLRYEEAVGSTGQSQGIYIQFLVSIINYISGMYAPEVEPDALKKVIFIDNPFGAAKDIYIWEPIFALLKTNNVQLIVPARGATPAITNRFDVNYILGQQLIGGRQQTVVVDYRSQVAQNEIEYQNLEYSQGTFDFI